MIIISLSLMVFNLTQLENRLKKNRDFRQYKGREIPRLGKSLHKHCFHERERDRHAISMTRFKAFGNEK